ncbi:ABC transporter ATP-binding protein [Amorphoplanes digitatis]|uniref:Oligopeptide transport system ATP-binding protein n=1 Tax=Actinoplanes digitatis TaxID=1868 RepID=A0A7W7I4S8_9ACTN|nr:ABC transporter ATP-binding protein [Actinoplanes digitatis]MBB4766450.1 oligopeptide transport system ATP-binding protein [Actinoplanes digitatis]BFE76537.1 ABC transporter ATP-binding protein [Actinoplanes digitatis]GID96719.1 ABC transporter ATP-binding protein [Actinoplanes digitatis]
MTDIKAQIDVLPGLDPHAPLLEVTDLHVEFRTQYGVARAVNGANFLLSPGETLAILGESGCGKSVTAQAIMGILDSPPGFITKGEVKYRGLDLLKLSENDRRKVRANQIAMIFQDALSALNPVFTIGYQMAELFRKHRGMSRGDAKRRSIELLDQVKIPAAKARIGDYPHQFSGGMRQRVMIAMALALDPEVLIADEPTTALDVTVQAQIMRLLAELQQQRNMGLILITHDMGVVADVADRISVMYAGKVVEEAPVYDIYARPAHPYTKALLESIPRLDMKGQQLKVIKGLPPALTDIPKGCAFNPRCTYTQDVCRQNPAPPPYFVAPGRTARCHFSREVAGE